MFGAEAQEAGEYLELWRDAQISHFRLEFAHETRREVERVADLFARAIAANILGQQLARELERAAPEGTTQGSLFVAPKYLSLPVLQ